MLITSRTPAFQTMPRISWCNLNAPEARCMLRLRVADYVVAIRNARAGQQALDAQRFAGHVASLRAKHSRMIRQQVAA